MTSPSRSGKWRALACLVTVLPAIGAVWGDWSVYQTFRGMAITGSGGIGTVCAGLSESLPFAVATLAASGVIAVFLAAALATRPARAAAFPGFLFSLLIAVSACVPVLLLWALDSFVFDVISSRMRGAGSISDASQHAMNLLLGTFLSALAVAGLALVGSISPLWRARPNAQIWPRVVVWAGAAIVLFCLAVLFYMRSTFLWEVAVRGHL